MLEIPIEALFLAGKASLSYRRSTGTKTSPLPDFYIGAQAAVLGMDLITRDEGRYRTYFPTVKIICHEKLKEKSSNPSLAGAGSNGDASNIKI